jgi:hypothetical protein
MDSGRIHEKKSVRHACKACCEFASISSPTTKFGGGNYRPGGDGDEYVETLGGEAGPF